MELVGSKIEIYAICYKLKSLEDNFVWGLIGIYGPNDDNLSYVLFDELMLFMSQWDIPSCLGGDFIIVRSPYETSSGGRLSSVMLEFSNIINSCGLIDLPLEGCHCTWSSHEVVPVL